MKRVVTLSLVVLMVAAVVAYGWLGRLRMENACSLSNAEGEVHESVTYSWSWRPLGFTCTYDDGTSETSLWP